MSYKLKYTGQKVQELLERAESGGTGEEALMYRSSINVDSNDSELPFSRFNRTPKVGDYFIALYTYIPGVRENPRIANIEITAVNNETQMASISVYSQTLVKGDIGETGEKGDTGADALVYKGEAINIDVLGNISIKTSLFNRTPIARDSFIALCGYPSQDLAGAYIGIFQIVHVRDDYASCAKMKTYYIKGPTGPRGAIGATGATPNITIDATINNNTGTPSATVTKSGDLENPSFSFDFKNLKGNTGDAGPIALVYGSIVSSDSIENIRLTQDVHPINFNRMPTQGESCIVIWNNTTDGRTYILSAVLGELKLLSRVNGFNVYGYALDTEKTTQQIITGPIGPMGTVFVPSISETGDVSWTNDGGLDNPKTVNVKGDTGEIALVYKGLYDTAFSNPTTVLILKFNNFNRTPKAGDRFVLFSTQSKYASCYVEGVDAESEDATCRFTDVVDTKGLPGADGAQGEIGPTGNVALQFDGILEIENPLKIEDFLQDGSYRFNASNYADNFNRTPVRGDSFLALAKYTYAPYNVFLVSAYIFAPTSASSYIKIAKYCDVSGQVGPRGADGANGVGFSTASVTATTTEEEYTTTTVTLTKTDSTTDTVEIKAKNAINPNTVSFIGTVTADMWQDSTTYSTYGYKYSALMPFTGGAYATDTYVPDIVPSVVSDIASGNFAPFANSLSTGVQVYAKSKPTATTNFNVSLSHVQ